MSATTLPVSEGEFDTFTPQGIDPSSFQPVPDVPVGSPASETQPLLNDDEPVVHLYPERVQRFFIPDVSWEGVVLEVLEGSFIARLVDRDDPSQSEEAEILNTAVSDQSDIELIVPGAIFFWSIGRRIEGRRSEQVSLIQFRRLPVWSKKEIQQSKQEASEIMNELGW
jgi:hypothetical protein